MSNIVVAEDMGPIALEGVMDTLKANKLPFGLGGAAVLALIGYTVLKGRGARRPLPPMPGMAGFGRRRRRRSGGRRRRR